MIIQQLGILRHNVTISVNLKFLHSANIYTYWNRSQFPRLEVAVTKYLSPTLVSIASEQLFLVPLVRSIQATVAINWEKMQRNFCSGIQHWTVGLFDFSC